MKRILLVLLALAAVGFGLDWGIYGGPGAAVSVTNMSPLQSALSTYDIPTIPNYQLGIATPLILRLWNFTLGGGDSYGWQTVAGDQYKTTFKHRINQAELGYVIDLSEHLRLRPVVGMGSYQIDLKIARLSGGFGSPDTLASDSRTYYYDNFSISAGVGLTYLWKFENRVVVGFEAKARYLVPLETNAPWVSDDASYDDVYVDGFWPHTPVVGVNFIIGYENVGEEKPDEDWDEWEE